MRETEDSEEREEDAEDPLDAIAVIVSLRTRLGWVRPLVVNLIRFYSSNVLLSNISAQK